MLVKIEQLSIANGNRILVKDLSLTCDCGAHAVIGANGSGKTTFLKTLVGIRPPQAGKVFLGGYDIEKEPVKAKSILSYVADKPLVYTFMSGLDYLQLIAYCKSQSISEAIYSQLELFDIRQYLHKKFSEMSLGTQRKFTLVGAMIGDPSVLALDEPLNGLDTKAQKILLDYVNSIKATKVVIFTSHSATFIDDLDANKIILQS